MCAPWKRPKHLAPSLSAAGALMQCLQLKSWIKCLMKPRDEPAYVPNVPAQLPDPIFKKSYARFNDNQFAETVRQANCGWPCLMNSGGDVVSVEPTLNPPGTWTPLSLVRINMLINGFMADGGRAIWYLSIWLICLQFIGQQRHGRSRSLEG